MLPTCRARHYSCCATLIIIWLLLLYIYGIGAPPSSIACALPRASKNKPLEWGLPLEAMVCKSGKQCTLTMTKIGTQT